MSVTIQVNTWSHNSIIIYAYNQYIGLTVVSFQDHYILTEQHNKDQNIHNYMVYYLIMNFIVKNESVVWKPFFLSVNIYFIKFSTWSYSAIYKLKHGHTRLYTSNLPCAKSNYFRVIPNKDPITAY